MSIRVNMKSIDLTNLLKAQQRFEEFRIDMIDDRNKAGAVQAFEFCFELAWKMMKRILASRGQETGSPKDIFRKAALEKIIVDPEIWFEFQEMRNLTSNAYEQEALDTIVAIFDSFSKELERVIKSMKELNGIEFGISENKEVTIRKAKLLDDEYLKTLQFTLDEWSSSNDDEDYYNL